LRAERLTEAEGLRYRLVVEERNRFSDKPISRSRIPAGDADPDALLLRFSAAREQMARRLLREGAHGWRRWSTLRRNAGRSFSPFAVEEVLDDLVRFAGVRVEDRFRNGAWLPYTFRVDESMWPWLEIVDPQQLLAALEADLTWQPLQTALADGKPHGMDWRSFDFCLRAAERLHDMRAHEIRPSSRELAGLIDHTKAWTEQRRAFVARLLGEPFEDLVAVADRQIGVRGPLAHAHGGLWASAIENVELEPDAALRDVVLVENKQTFEHLLALAQHGVLVLWVPGGPPPAEVALVRRLHELAPSLRFHACFDLDPAGIRIARLLEQKTEATLEPTGMTVDLLADAERRLELNAWDHTQLARGADWAGVFEPLREALTAAGAKVEQETIQRLLYDRLLAATARDASLPTRR
jgi:hypothetical protein